MPTRQNFINELDIIFTQAKALGLIAIDLLSKNLHDRVMNKFNQFGNRMPSCCSAIRTIHPTNYKTFQIIKRTPSLQSSSLVIRYYL